MLLCLFCAHLSCDRLDKPENIQSPLGTDVTAKGTPATTQSMGNATSAVSYDFGHPAPSDQLTLPHGAAFGGSPPWGLEKPSHFHGKINAGGSFEHPIGAGLSLYVLSVGDMFAIHIDRSGTGGAENFAGCVTPPLHGINPSLYIEAWDFNKEKDSPTGGNWIGRKRRFNFVLTPDNNEIECNNIRGIGLNDWGARASGTGWLEVTSVRLGDARPGMGSSKILSMAFEAECTLYGAWELWRLPALYVIPGDFTGWVMVHYRQKDAPELPLAEGHYTIRINKSAVVRTSSNLRRDRMGAQFVSMDGKPLRIEGSGRSIRCWIAGNNTGDVQSAFQSFFVGTPDDFKQSPHNPILPPKWDCPD
jgi:hypothetical protein